MRDPSRPSANVEVEWLRPWRQLDAEEAAAIERELQTEVGPMHPLWSRAASALGRREDNDDVLVATGDPGEPLAVVHLTWSGRLESSAKPRTVFFGSWAAWVEECMQPDADVDDDA